MENTVSIMSIIVISIVLLLGIAIPVGLLIAFRKKYHCSITAFFIGCAVMVVFAFMLESVFHAAVLSSPVGTTIRTNLWLYGLYGGVAAGLFEEGGRFLAFRFVLKKKQDNNYNALMYGAGHGGIEMMLLMSVTMLNNLLYAIMINSGAMTQILNVLPAAELESMQSVISQLAQASPLLFLVSLAERLASMVLQLSFSVLVWFAAKDKQKIILLPLAFGLHMLVDSVMVILSQSGWNMVFVEGWIYLMAAGSAWIALWVWKKEMQKEEMESDR